LAEPGATVVVATLNRGGFLAECLADLLAQEHRPLEILVVDQSAEVPGDVLRLADGNPELVSYHRVGFRGLPEARNYGWQHAKYDAIIFVDDDIRCGPRLVSEHVRALGAEGVGVVAGGIDVSGAPAAPSDARAPAARFSRWTATPVGDFAVTGEMEVEHAKGANFSATREAIRAAGGFDEALNVGPALYEELEFCLRARALGRRILYNGSARLTHLAAPGGGCRVGEAPRYVHGLAHNRAVVIRRHVGLLRAPVALARLGILILSHAVRYRSVGAVFSGIAGCAGGLRDGGRPPVCTPRTRPQG